MKTVEEIRAEIRKIDEALDITIEQYKEGIITEIELNRQKVKYESAKNALEWVIK